MKRSFTTSELIVVILILGIIALDTMISLSYRWKRRDLELGFIKAYSTLMQVTQRMQTDEDSIWDSYNYNDNKWVVGYDYQTSFQNAFMSYFSGIKDCGSKGCVPDTMSYENANVTNKFNGVGMTQKQFYSSDGMLFFPVVFTDDPYIIAIYVDTNGYNKKPNRAGYDLFLFQILKNDKLVTMGAGGSVWENPNFCDLSLHSNNGAVNGRSCAYRALTEENYFQNLP